MLWLLTHAALADCMGTTPATTPAAEQLPTAATLFHFVDQLGAPQPDFAARGPDGAPLPLAVAAQDAGGATAWRLSVESPPGPVTVLADGHPIAAYTAVSDWAPEPAALQGVEWSRFAWACSHEDGLVVQVAPNPGVAAWALAWGGGEVVLPPSTSSYFGAPFHDPEHPLRLVLGKASCVPRPSVSWSGVPSAWTLSLTPIFADGARGAPITRALDLDALRGATGR